MASRSGRPGWDPSGVVGEQPRVRPQYQAAPLTELPILATVTVARAVWDDVFVRQGMKRLGYPMDWEDLD